MCSSTCMILAHKIALNPTGRQERLLWEHVGYARFAANSAIADFREGLAAGEWRNDKTLRPRWNATQGRTRALGYPSQPERGEERHTQRRQGNIQVGRLQACPERGEAGTIRRLSPLAQARRSRQLSGRQRPWHRERCADGASDFPVSAG